MAQHDYSIANQGFPSFRSDLNNVLSAINTNNLGATAPGVTSGTTAVQGQIYADTGTTGKIIFKQILTWACKKIEQQPFPKNFGQI